MMFGFYNLVFGVVVELVFCVNDWIVEICVCYFDCFQGFVVLLMFDFDVVLCEFECVVCDFGLKGVLLCGWMWEWYFDYVFFCLMLVKVVDLCVLFFIYLQILLVVVCDVNYFGISECVDFVFVVFGFGWYYEVGL